MAVVTKSVVAAGGADYTTIQAAVNAVNVTSDQWDIEVDDNSSYGQVDITGFTGTPDATNYMRLTGGASNRHAGVTGTGHPRITATTNHCVIVSEHYTVIEWMDLIQNSNGSSDEGVRIDDDITPTLISHCIIHSSNAAADQDGIYQDNGGTSGTRQVINIDNCSIYNFYRAGIHHQNWSGESHVTWNIDHNTIMYCGNRAATENESGAIHIRSDNVNSVHDVNIYNNAMGETENNATQERDVVDGSPSRGVPDGTCTWAGSHNLTAFANVNPYTDIDGTNNTTSWQHADDGVATVTKSADNWLVVVGGYSLSAGDLTLLNGTDAGNIALTNGTNRQGSEPDSRQDFSVDGTGHFRPTTSVDIGFHQATESGVTLESVSSGSGGTGSTTFTITEPSGATTGDRLVVVVHQDFDGEDTLLAHSDWTKLIGAGTASDRSVAAFEIISRGASAPNLTGFEKVSNSGYGWVCYRLTGDGTAAAHVKSTVVTNADVNLSPPTLTTSAPSQVLAGAFGAVCFADNRTSGTSLPPSGMVEDLDVAADAWSTFQVCHETNILAGDYDPGDNTRSSSSTTDNVMLTIAVDPAGGSLEVTLPTIASAEATYAPVLHRVLTLPTLAAATVLYTPAAALQIDGVTLPFISAATSIFTPTGVVSQILTLPFISSATQIFTPTGGVSLLVTLPFVSGTVLWDPHAEVFYVSPHSVPDNPPNSSQIIRQHQRGALGLRHG